MQFHMFVIEFNKSLFITSLGYVLLAYSHKLLEIATSNYFPDKNLNKILILE